MPVHLSDSHSIGKLVQCFVANAASLMKRAAKEDWQAERQQNSAKVSNSAHLLINEVQPSELVAFNLWDLQMPDKTSGMRLPLSAKSGLTGKCSKAVVSLHPYSWMVKGEYQVSNQSGCFVLSSPSRWPRGLRKLFLKPQ